MEIKPWQDVWMDEFEARKSIDPKKICTFGIKALDDAFIGILKNDLVVIGADSGVGKSEISLNIALHNASCGKKVALYFIEGGAEEAIARIKWKLIKNKYYDEGYRGIDMDYRKWRMNAIDSDDLINIEEKCMKEFEEKIKDNLQIYCFDSSFKIENLINSLGYFSSKVDENKLDVDLIIIDHLQYFSLANPKSELTEMTDILMRVKEITNFYKVPVLLVSHLRKKDKDRGLPSQEDFYGTGNIAKISSISITIAPDSAYEDYNKNLYPTFFRVVKSRTGIRSTYAIRCNFDLMAGKYEDEYQIYKLLMDKPFKDPLEPFKCPKWAKVKVESTNEAPDVDWQND